jgi:hypothetical protein
VAKLNADEADVEAVTRCFGEREGLGHLRATKRADVITLVSGDIADPFAHARLRRVSTSHWQLEMPAGSGSRWQATPFRGPLPDVLALLVDSFGWTLAAMDF